MYEAFYLSRAAGNYDAGVNAKLLKSKGVKVYEIGIHAIEDSPGTGQKSCYSLLAVLITVFFLLIYFPTDNP